MSKPANYFQSATVNRLRIDIDVSQWFTVINGTATINTHTQFAFVNLNDGSRILPSNYIQNP